MKYFIAVLGLLLIAGCVRSSTTSAPVNIVGLWKGTYDKVVFGPPRELAFNFISDGLNVGGFMRNEAQQSDWIRLDNFIMKGDKIYFTTANNTPQGVIKLTYKGRLVDSEIKLTATVERQGSSDNPLRGTRPSFRYEGGSAGGSNSSNTIDQANPGNIASSARGVINGMIYDGSSTFTIRKVQ